jgi:hypothetical protein
MLKELAGAQEVQQNCAFPTPLARDGSYRAGQRSSCPEPQPAFWLPERLSPIISAIGANSRSSREALLPIMSEHRTK